MKLKNWFLETLRTNEGPCGIFSLFNWTHFRTVSTNFQGKAKVELSKIDYKVSIHSYSLWVERNYWIVIYQVWSWLIDCCVRFGCLNGPPFSDLDLQWPQRPRVDFPPRTAIFQFNFFVVIFSKFSIFQTDRSRQANVRLNWPISKTSSLKYRFRVQIIRLYLTNFTIILTGIFHIMLLYKKWKKPWINN